MSSGARVVVLEDNPLHLDLCRDSLIEAGYEVLGISDFSDMDVVVKRVVGWRPLLVVLDERLSGTELSGIWIVSQLKQNLPHTTEYILFSAYTDDPGTVRAYAELGVAGSAILKKSEDLVPELKVAVEMRLRHAADGPRQEGAHNGS